VVKVFISIVFKLKLYRLGKLRR